MKQGRDGGLGTREKADQAPIQMWYTGALLSLAALALVIYHFQLNSRPFLDDPWDYAYQPALVVVALLAGVWARCQRYPSESMGPVPGHSRVLLACLYFGSVFCILFYLCAYNVLRRGSWTLSDPVRESQLNLIVITGMALFVVLLLVGNASLSPVPGLGNVFGKSSWRDLRRDPYSFPFLVAIVACSAAFPAGIIWVSIAVILLVPAKAFYFLPEEGGQQSLRPRFGALAWWVVLGGWFIVQWVFAPGDQLEIAATFQAPFFEELLFSVVVGKLIRAYSRGAVDAILLLLVISPLFGMLHYGQYIYAPATRVFLYYIPWQRVLLTGAYLAYDHVGIPVLLHSAFNFLSGRILTLEWACFVFFLSGTILIAAKLMHRGR